MNRKEIIFKSADQINNIMAYIYYPDSDNEIKGIVQIAHGMSEYFKRYEDFAIYLVKKGYVVCGNDHLGHGKLHEKNLGYMGKKKGNINMIHDMRFLQIYTQNMFEDIPYFLLGHSMGSFLSRLFTGNWGNTLDGLILSGTGNASKLDFIVYRLGIIYTSIVGFIRGYDKPAYFLANTMEKMFNKKFKPSNTNLDWLSRDEVVVNAYIDDIFCGFPFTYAGYRDLFKTIIKVSKKSFFYKFPKNLPVLMFSGSMDPVGREGKRVYDVYKNLDNVGLRNIEIKLFDRGRHEILNEINKDEVYAYVYKWIEENNPK